MSKSDDDDRPKVNTGNQWSEMDPFDLANEIRLNRSIEFIADFLCRSRQARSARRSPSWNAPANFDALLQKPRAVAQ